MRFLSITSSSLRTGCPAPGVMPIFAANLLTHPAYESYLLR